MTRNKTPSNIIQMRGGYKKHPERRNRREPVPSAGIGKAPETFGTKFSDVWDEVVAICPGGVLGNSDRIALEILVKLLIEFRTDPTSVKGGRLTQLNSMLSKFGFTPSDRTRIAVPAGKGNNEFEDLG
jgi:hypothetical protein